MTPGWWADRGPVAQALRPVSWLYRGLTALDRAVHPPGTLPVPVVVVGNWVAGGAGKTPTLLHLLALLRAEGVRAGVVSRGHGRRTKGVVLVHAASTAADVGDEPLLIARRSGAPVAVGERRLDAARALLAAQPDLQLLLSDDGLQHRALPRHLEVLVFDRRGVGNGLLLPAGPLRQDAAHATVPQLVLYTEGAGSTPLPGFLAQRELAGAMPLTAWWQGAEAVTPFSALPSTQWFACAGIAKPQAFFDALAAAGRPVKGLPLADHDPLRVLPWPTDAPVLVTEKDAVKLAPERPGCARVWVVPMRLKPDTAFDAAFLAALSPLLRA